MAVKQGRRGEILAAAGMLFAEKGVVATTVREIADEVGILSGSLYHHFASKDEILDAIIMAYLDDIAAKYSRVAGEAGNAEEQLRSLIRATLESAFGHPAASEIYQNNNRYLRSSAQWPEMNRIAGQIRQTWLDTLTRGREEGVFRNDIPVQVSFRLMRDGLWLSMRWFRPADGFGLEEFIESASAMFLEGLTTKD
ncbi:TetR/AcrR family transcriptional regulator [Enemella sp. A6]|uniref:TetR/AcrR family transcriptional regulator n=1 Tax=Enemella sp. A6 TaxID=3440152 RepID=UPI003EBE8F19